MAYTWIFSKFNNTFISLANNIIVYFVNLLFPRLIEIISTPFVHPEIFWIILPLIIATILMLLYFGRYRNEELGWNTAFSNNIVLIFVSINLIQHLHSLGELWTNKSFFVYFILLYNIVLLVMNYFHSIPKNLSFLINSTIPINIINYLAILTTYSNIPIDITTFVASLILILIIYGLSKILWIFVPMSKGSKIFQSLQNKKAEKIKLNEERKLKRNENIDIRERKSVIFCLISYFVFYILMVLFNKLIYPINDYYLLIFSLYFIIFTIIYMRSKKLSFRNLLIFGTPLKRDLGVLIGVLIFFYYIVASNFFINVLPTDGFKTNSLLLIISIIIFTITSEVFFRGLIQRCLKIRFNKTVSVGLQALMWSLLKQDIFNLTLSTIPQAIIGLIIIFPIGLLLGFLKEEWWFDSVLSASLTNSLLAIITLFL